MSPPFRSDSKEIARGYSLSTPGDPSPSSSTVATQENVTFLMVAMSQSDPIRDRAARIKFSQANSSGLTSTVIVSTNHMQNFGLGAKDSRWRADQGLLGGA